VSDYAVLAARLDAALRRHGVRAGTRRAQTFAEALAALAPATRAATYHIARAAMLPSIDDLAAFDAAFDDVAPGGAPLRPPDAPHVHVVPQPPPPAETPATPEDAAAAPLQRVTASLAERLRERDFDTFSADERAQMLRMIESVRVPRELRRSRRRRRNPHGDRFDLGATLRAGARTGGELIRRRTTSRRERLRPLVFLLDVSGSMAPFARALLQYARVAARARPGVRAFAFATRLTDLTHVLRHAGDAQLAALLGSAVRDFGGGTNIGANLRAFNDRYAQRGVARGGTVVILSDGWERGDPALLAAEMARLRRLTHRIVWVNPHKRHPAYEPLVAGMAAALPFVDAFVSGHNVRSLDAVADAVGYAIKTP
jgi:uncharacterized protein with von Willebrand factor type A (vWA) domain